MAEKRPTHNFDLIVLGSGPAGEKGAAQAAYFGKRVAMVERDRHLGGAAAGAAIPSKALRETSVALSGMRARRLHTVDVALRGQATIADFLHHERAVKDAERSRAMTNMLQHGVALFEGVGSFVAERTVRVEAPGGAPEFLRGDIILVATGSRPRWPDSFPRDDRICDSDSILQISSMPEVMMVVGGGVIGCECACTFAALGVDVSLVHSKDVLLPFLDRDTSRALESSMSGMGIDLLMPDTVESCTAHADRLEIGLGSGGVSETEVVMLATGRTSNTEELALEAAGITPGRYGVLVVNEDYQVVHPETREPVPGIYAAGDVIGAPALASTSMEQARFAMIKAFDLEPYKEHVAPILPLGIHTIPECALAGKTEEECREEGTDYVVGRAAYSQNARGMIIGDGDGFLKLIFEFNEDLTRPMKLLGAHAIGESASELIHIGVIALMTGAGSDLLIDACFNYPTLGELYKYATYDAMGSRAAV